MQNIDHFSIFVENKYKNICFVKKKENKKKTFDL